MPRHHQDPIGFRSRLDPRINQLLRHERFSPEGLKLSVGSSLIPWMSATWRAWRRWASESATELRPTTAMFQHWAAPVVFLSGRYCERYKETLIAGHAAQRATQFIISGDEGAVQFLRSGYCVALPQLKSIQLDFWQQTFSYSYFDKAFLSTIEWLPKILALLPPSIEEIILLVEESAAPEHKLGTINWSPLNKSLTGSQYPSLRILKIRMSRYHTKEMNQELQEMWPKLLPICARKGILAPLITTN
ncbi:hypothetical protein DFH09DRAFT_1459516 [Mycena vulgaris]|nr:hypothetical protein DFH09DRAFT_1459516 [Mycena vulgaris]